MCRALQVSQQGYYQFLYRPDRALRDRELRSRSYEYLREKPEDVNYGIQWIGAARLLHLREHHLTIRPKWRASGTTKADSLAKKSENLIHHLLQSAPDQPDERRPAAAGVLPAISCSI